MARQFLTVLGDVGGQGGEESRWKGAATQNTRIVSKIICVNKAGTEIEQKE